MAGLVATPDHTWRPCFGVKNILYTTLHTYTMSEDTKGSCSCRTTCTSQDRI